MKNYRDYTSHDLSRDASFYRWVVNNAPDDTAFWLGWLAENPDRMGTVEQARDFLLALHTQYTSPISQAEVQRGVANILAQTESGLSAETRVVPLRRIGQRWGYWAAAAMVVLVAGLGWQLMRDTSILTDLSTGQTAARPIWNNRTNTGTKPQTLLLADGSVVTLEPNSTLRYPSQFSSPKRTVTLQGEAFFEIAHNPKQPFVVTTSDFTTTVLGTSFRVRSSSPQHRAFVVVRSGKVAVQSRLRPGPATALVGAGQVILTANQQVTSQPSASKPLLKAVVQENELTVNEVNAEQVFDDVAVAQVFDALEKQYGILIGYDKEVLRNCSINTAFDQENLRERLSAICQAIGASYLITDNKISIISSGCTL